MSDAWLGLVAAALGVPLVVLLQLRRREVAGLRRRLEVATRELERLQRAFQRFAPSDVVEEIIAQGLASRGERREATVLFADLVGYTQLSEQVDPSVLVRILNGWFERASRSIVDHRGRVSTFVGDAILALFGALEPNPWQCDDAVHAALALREAVAAYGHDLEAEGLPPLSLGVGIHRGVGVAGLVGSHAKVEFTVIGRATNLAARVQGLTRELGVDILVTRPVRDALDPRFSLRALPSAEVKGIAEPVEIFAVAGFGGAPRSGGSAPDA
jgi:class 3 adenylate cyclase